MQNIESDRDQCLGDWNPPGVKIKDGKCDCGGETETD